MYTVKRKFPKGFEKFPERCQCFYIHSIMKYGINMEVEPIFWKLGDDAQLGYISEIMQTEKDLILKSNKEFYSLFTSEFTIKNDMKRLINCFNNYYWNMNNQYEVLNFYLDFTENQNYNIIYQTINTFINIYNLNDKNISLPNEMWYMIFEKMNYYSILKFRLQLKKEIFTDKSSPCSFPCSFPCSLPSSLLSNDKPQLQIIERK